MAQKLIHGITMLLISSAFLTGPTSVAAASEAAANSDLYLAGLALHQETGRDIYLGGIYFDRSVPKPDDLVGASGPKVMEYRVVARRTSIRSLLGSMLLQSEVATGQPPGEATTEFANNILSIVSSSLYAGDSLEIILSDNDETIALLNGQELARVNNGEVSDYLLMGWVGEHGPATQFRHHIIAEEINPALLSTLEKNTYSDQRKAQVVGWLGVTEDIQSSVLQPIAANQMAAIAEPIAEPLAEPLAEPYITTSPDTAVDLSPVAIEQTDQVVPEPVDPAHDLQAIQVASLIPTAGMLQALKSDSGIQALGVQEYSRRLSAFHSQLIAMVYGEIHYPTRAVRRGLQGGLELDITLHEDGQLLNIKIAQPSGYAILDKAAVKAAQRALSSVTFESIDPVAIAEFSGGETNNLIIPVPVKFMLTE